MRKSCRPLSKRWITFYNTKRERHCGNKLRLLVTVDRHHHVFSNGSMIAVQKDPSWDMCMLWISVYHDSDESSRLTTLGTLLVSTPLPIRTQ